MTLERTMNTATIRQRDGHFRLSLNGQANSLQESGWLHLNVKQMEEAMDKCMLCRMIYTEVMKTIPPNAHVLHVFKIQDPDRGMISICLYHGLAEVRAAMLCCYADEGTERHGYVGR